MSEAKMNADGAHLGLLAQVTFKRIMGEPLPAGIGRLSRTTMLERIRAATATGAAASYDGSALYTARGMFEFALRTGSLDAPATLLDFTRRWRSLDPASYAAHVSHHCGPSLFQYGWAYNAVRYALDLPAVQNLALGDGTEGNPFYGAAAEDIEQVAEVRAQVREGAPAAAEPFQTGESGGATVSHEPLEPLQVLANEALGMIVRDEVKALVFLREGDRAAAAYAGLDGPLEAAVMLMSALANLIRSQCRGDAEAAQKSAGVMFDQARAMVLEKFHV